MKNKRTSSNESDIKPYDKDDGHGRQLQKWKFQKSQTISNKIWIVRNDYENNKPNFIRGKHNIEYILCVERFHWMEQQHTNKMFVSYSVQFVSLHRYQIPVACFPLRFCLWKVFRKKFNIKFNAIAIHRHTHTCTYFVRIAIKTNSSQSR